MTIYLHDIPLSQARLRLDEALKAAGRIGVLGSEVIPLIRVLPRHEFWRNQYGLGSPSPTLSCTLPCDALRCPF